MRMPGLRGYLLSKSAVLSMVLAGPGAKPKTTDAGDGIEFSVRDQGTGVPEQILDRVFDPFFTTKPMGKGTGLGLSMVFGFATQCGGEVKIENLEKGGALVRLWLPEVLPELNRHDQPTPIQPTNLETLKVLLVEDDSRVRDIMVRMLGLLRQETETCETAESALELLDQKGYQMVITDVMLGSGMDGIALSDQIRERFPETHVLLTSGYPERVIAEGIELSPA